ncbi:hypothetical protein HPB48_009055 [Haemaphysalis longicornis]|uniref:Uncharacterized protein n=1 Tax=Haemaphysalis longicornis TaxID=44386 RepID=A0A9J6G8L5_HAELO|nr:hypothetical protein HPB48_009055 [Haemaphysalis longicornis]
MKILDEVKLSQEALENTMSNINTRLVAVEARVNALDQGSDPRLEAATNAVRSENAELRCRLDDFEDRARRDNLILYGVADNPKETWSQSEDLVRTLVSSHIKVQIAQDGIERAHRLGTFVLDKSRPIIVKFSSFKVKDTIFAMKGKLKSAGISISEDFCKGN